MLTVGAIAKKRPILSVRELTREDLGCLREPRTKVPVVARFKDPHHRIARLFASGLRQAEVHIRSGYSYNRIATLVADPAFQELIAHYRGLVDQAFIDGVDDYYELATSNMLKAERQIAEKLEEAEDANETLPTRDLLAISRDAADRFGYGKKQTNLNVNVDFAAQLEKAIKRSGKVLDAIGSEQASSPPAPIPLARAPSTSPGPISRRI